MLFYSFVIGLVSCSQTKLNFAASTLPFYIKLKPADADRQRELGQVCLKLGDREGSRPATALADALEISRRP